MTWYTRQTEPGPCVNCHGHGEVPVETYYGDPEQDDYRECDVCGGKGELTAEDIARCGWTPEATP